MFNKKKSTKEMFDDSKKRKKKIIKNVPSKNTSPSEPFFTPLEKLLLFLLIITLLT